ncbi:MAG: B12-binding domain-containing radical SAM protein [Candidatus Odinarchaeia archaeon]
MKVTLINPPIPARSYSSELTAQPLGLVYLAAVLLQEGHKVNVIDCHPLGYTAENVKEKVRKNPSDVYGITATTLTIDEAIKTAKAIKELQPDGKIVLGGPHVTFTDTEILQNYPFVDVVVRGEGEETFSELINQLEVGGSLETIKGITYRDNNGKIRRNEDRPLISNLDELPFPARELLPLDSYKAFGVKLPSFSILSSRGCPFGCNFCAVSKMFGRKFRARSAKNVVDEIEYLISKFNATHFTFVDDIFTINKRRVIEIINEIKARKLDISWDCETRVDMVDKMLLIKMRKAGCQTMFFGVESGDQRILDRMGKGITLDQIRRAFKLTKEVGMFTIASIMLFYPGETEDSLKNTFKLLRELDPDLVQFSIATPFPGTKFYEEVKQNNMLRYKKWFKYDIVTPVLKLPDFTATQMKRIWEKAYTSFYLRPSYIVKQIAKKNLATLKAMFNYAQKLIRIKVKFWKSDVKIS